MLPYYILMRELELPRNQLEIIVKFRELAKLMT